MYYELGIQVPNFVFYSDMEALHTYRHDVATIQRDSVWWLHTVVPKSLDVKPAEFGHW